MAVEDFTTYTLSSAGGTIGVTSTRATATAFDTRGATKGYVQSDKGASHFTGDFSHLVTMFVSSQGANALYAAWQLSDLAGDQKSQLDASSPYMTVFLSDSSRFLILRDWRSSTFNDSSTYTLSVDTPYYLTIGRVGTAMTCKIYSDSGRTDLLSTLSITLASATSFRYVAVSDGYNDGAGGVVSGYIENLDLQESAAGGYSVSLRSPIQSNLRWR